MTGRSLAARTRWIVVLWTLALPVQPQSGSAGAPQRLTYREISAPSMGSFSVQWTGGALRTRQSSTPSLNAMPSQREGRLFLFDYEGGIWERQTYPSALQWRRFWQALEKAKVWRWQGRYDNPRVHDGLLWRLEIARGGRNSSVQAEGLNAYPADDEVREPNVSGGFSRPFTAFRQALEALAGPFPSGSVQTAEPIETPVPPATDDLLRRFPAKEVLVEVTIEPDGGHRERITRGSGDAKLDAALRDALRRWKWKPAATEEGKPLADTRRLRLRRPPRPSERT